MPRTVGATDLVPRHRRKLTEEEKGEARQRREAVKLKQNQTKQTDVQLRGSMAAFLMGNSAREAGSDGATDVADESGKQNQPGTEKRTDSIQTEPGLVPAPDAAKSPNMQHKERREVHVSPVGTLRPIPGVDEDNTKCGDDGNEDEDDFR